MQLLTRGNAAKRLSWALLFVFSFSGTVGAEEGQSSTFDGLIAVEESSLAMAYVDPKADFSVFERVMILDPIVAFRSNWQQDQRRQRAQSIRGSDMERIRQDTAALWKQVFSEQLETAGFEVVNALEEDVLTLRPAIIDLDVVAPVIQRGQRSTLAYTATTGSATLILELFDASTGDLVGRVADRQTATKGEGYETRANRVSNRSAAATVFRGWADALIDMLNMHYAVSSETAAP